MSSVDPALNNLIGTINPEFSEGLGRFNSKNEQGKVRPNSSGFRLDPSPGILSLSSGTSSFVFKKDRKKPALRNESDELGT